MRKSVLRIGVILFLFYSIFIVIVYFQQRSLLFHPSHQTAAHTMLVPWSDGPRIIGFCHEAPHPQTIWLMTHGNAGQAADRDYALQRLSPRDSLYVLEYPGYGERDGSPNSESMNHAASEAYQLLRSRNPHTPVCALGESIGTGPACALALEKNPPDKIVLMVPFDTLANVAARHFPWLPVRLMLHDNWNNVEALKHFSGPVDIYGAIDDNVIPIQFARALAREIPQAHFVEIPGGHNEWADEPQVKIER